MKIFVVTLFPELMLSYLNTSIMKKAQDTGAVYFTMISLRSFGIGNYKQVDDAPYGGGPGMLLRPEPVFSAVESIGSTEKPRRILLTPQGKRFTQADAYRLSKKKSLLFICGHYEGFDERIRCGLADEEISIGDYVLSGGELPALVAIDAITRLVQGVLPAESTRNDSFSRSDNFLEYPQYTRPPEFRGMKVPDVLLSGNHAAIEKWRNDQVKTRTIRCSEGKKQGKETED